MCVDYELPHKNAIQEFIKSLGRRKTFTGYKVIHPDGTPAVFDSSFSFYNKPKYKPGHHYATNNRGKRISNSYRYSHNNSAGIHIYRTLWNAKIMCGPNRCILKVTCHIDDILCVGGDQIALSKIYISKKQWKNRC